MQTATSETEIKFHYLSICVHHYTLRAPCPKGQGKTGPVSVLRNPTTSVLTATTFIYAIGAGITAAAGHFYRATHVTSPSTVLRGDLHPLFLWTGLPRELDCPLSFRPLHYSL